MITAGLLAWGGRLHGCIIDDRGRPRHFTARNTPAARDAICRTLVDSHTHDVVLLAHADIDPVAELLARSGLYTWRAQQRFLEDVVATHPDRRGPRSKAAILARLPNVPAWLALLAEVTLPPSPPEQLPLL